MLQKEKDLELTARIGKELLANNQRLENNVASLEAELRTTNEKLTQLNHELQKKTELIQVSSASTWLLIPFYCQAFSRPPVFLPDPYQR